MMRLNERVWMVVASMLFLGTAVACGPSWSTANINSAQRAIAAADKVNASQLAPYEYTSAVQYLKKAKELWGHSKFGDSKNYAAKAEEMAKSAAEKAQRDPWKDPLNRDGVIEAGK